MVAFVNLSASIPPDDVHDDGSDTVETVPARIIPVPSNLGNLDSPRAEARAMFCLCSHWEVGVVTVMQMAEIGTMTDAEAATVAYLEAAEGDVERALAFAVEDILRVEGELVNALSAVSHGYVRGSISAP